MSNRRKRQARRRKLSTYERWMADRYRPHRQYTAAEVRKILVDDGIARRPTPLAWFMLAIDYISVKDRTDKDTVFIQINDEVRSVTGFNLPTSGLTV